jgi:hypothetical protein
MSAPNDRYWRKADIGLTRAEWLLLTQSGHSVCRYRSTDFPAALRGGSGHEGSAA